MSLQVCFKNVFNIFSILTFFLINLSKLLATCMYHNVFLGTLHTQRLSFAKIKQAKEQRRERDHKLGLKIFYRQNVESI